MGRGAADTASDDGDGIEGYNCAPGIYCDGSRGNTFVYVAARP
jgi:hypothetical protein